MKPTIHIKRAYDKPLKKDGYRVLVDRLWPRGLNKEEVKIDDWAKAIAPSPALRKWYGHEPERWDSLQKKYKAELNKNIDVDDFIEQHKDRPLITLVYAAKDEEHTHAIVLQHFLKEKFQ